jgi:glycosyltransferase involved in cell wall biosynthesis
MKVLILGNFGYYGNQIDGQTIKTRNIYQLFKNKLDKEVSFIDLSEGKGNKFLFFKVFLNLIKCNSLIYLPGRNNLKFIFPILYVISLIFNFKINYIVIGGWLPEFLKRHKMHALLLKRINAIFIETDNMNQKLKDWFDFRKNYIIPNFRIHNFSKIINNPGEILKIVFMSRIILEKGIDLIFDFVQHAKNAKPNFYFQLDFYGQINPTLSDYFLSEINKYSNINYIGVAEPDLVHEILNKYDVMLLPTRYVGEGFPGAILDAYISSIPVIASKWKDIPSFIDEGETGFTFELNDVNEFYNYIYKLGDDKQLLTKMKISAFEKSLEYSSDKCWQIIEKTIL